MNFTANKDWFSVPSSYLPTAAGANIYGGSGSLDYNTLPSFKIRTGGNMRGVYEVVIIQEDEEGDDKLVFGPKAYQARDEKNAVAQAVVESGVKPTSETEFKTRFFG